jgi:hypothetical protein
MHYVQVLDQARLKQQQYLDEAERDSMVQEAKEKSNSRSLRQMVAQKLVAMGERLAQQPQEA